MSTRRLLVPVANPETADRLLDTAIDIARDRGLSLLVVHVVVAPMQLSLEQARDELDVDEERAVVDYALEYAREAGVPATGRIRFGRGVARGVLTIAEDDVEAILLGWRGRPRRRDIVLGSYIDEILADAPCDVLVKRIDRDRTTVSSILVPVAGGPNTEYAAEIAGSLARAHGARIELVTVVSTGDRAEIEDGRTLLTRTSAALGAVESVEETVLVGEDVVETICVRSSEHDVTVLGAAQGGLLRRTLVGDVAEAIGRDAESAVVVAKRHQGVPDALWRRVRDRLR